MIGGIVAIVPIRSLTGGKTRLAGVLSPDERTRLTRWMLRGVVRAALDSGTINAVVVVSPDPEALALAASLDPAVIPLVQSAETPGLNPAIAQAVAYAASRRAAAALVLFGDLPLLTGEDVKGLLRRDAPVVIAPDRHGTGTNALMLRFGLDRDEGGAFQFHYGPGSYGRHLDEADRRGLDVATSLTAGTALDLDTPDDLQRVFGSIEAARRLDVADRAESFPVVPGAATPLREIA